jgi:hypothetical protein
VEQQYAVVGKEHSRETRSCCGADVGDSLL